MMIGIDEAYLSDQNKSKVVLDIEALANSYEKDLGKMHFADSPISELLLPRVYRAKCSYLSVLQCLLLAFAISFL